MADSIRRQIMTAIAAALSAVRTTAGYATDAGATVYRARTAVDPDAAPLINVFDGRETAERDRYGMVTATMPVTVEAIDVFSADDPAATEDHLLADVIEAMTATVCTLAFTTGATEIETGDTVTGAVSGATAFVAGVTVATGSWAGGNAAGTLTVRRLTGTFRAENLKVGGAVHAATTGTITGQHAVTRVTGGLATSIAYTGGGPVNRAHLDDTMTGVTAAFDVVYRTVPGNPYGQGT